MTSIVAHILLVHPLVCSVWYVSILVLWFGLGMKGRTKSLWRRLQPPVTLKKSMCKENEWNNEKKSQRTCCQFGFCMLLFDTKQKEKRNYRFWINQCSHRGTSKMHTLNCLKSEQKLLKQTYVSISMICNLTQAI